MDGRFNKLVTNADSGDIVRRIKMHTPARLLLGRAGAAYRTETQLQLREDQAKARDGPHRIGPENGIQLRICRTVEAR